MIEQIPAWLRFAGIAFLGLVFLLLLAPFVVVVGASLSQSNFIHFPPSGITLKWYREVLGSGAYLSAMFLSLQIALAVTVIATLLGGAASIAIHRRVLPGSDFLSMVFMLPLMLPTIIYAVGLLTFWSVAVGPVSPVALVISHSVLALPYVVRTTLAVLAESDPKLEEAARTMGANRLQRLFLVVVPQCIPGLAAGAFFAFNISFDEAVLSLFMRSPDMTTLPIQIYGQLEFNPDPSVAAVSSILIGITVLIVLSIEKILGLGRVASA